MPQSLAIWTISLLDHNLSGLAVSTLFSTTQITCGVLGYPERTTNQSCFPRT